MHVCVCVGVSACVRTFVDCYCNKYSKMRSDLSHTHAHAHCTALPQTHTHTKLQKACYCKKFENELRNNERQTCQR